MSIALERRRYMGSGSLPYDAEIEYLQSSGTQYIQTAFVDDSNDYYYSCKVAPMQSSIMNFFGVRASGTSATSTSMMMLQAFNSAYTGFPFITYGQSLATPPVYGTTPLVGVAQSLNYMELNQSRTPTEMAIPLFGLSIQGTMYLYSSRIYSWRVTDSEANILADYIPVRVGTEGYMYDRVSGQLFGNAGSGSFILGPDV